MSAKNATPANVVQLETGSSQPSSSSRQGFTGPDYAQRQQRWYIVQLLKDVPTEYGPARCTAPGCDAIEPEIDHVVPLFRERDKHYPRPADEALVDLVLYGDSYVRRKYQLRCKECHDAKTRRDIYAFEHAAQRGEPDPWERERGLLKP